jgi:hypothetical protein
MRQVCIAVVLLLVSLRAVTQESAGKPKVSDDQLTTEQIAVYRAVLSDFLKGSDGALKLASITEPLDHRDKSCFKGMDVRLIKESASLVHRLEPSFVTDTKIVLVDPDRQQKAIEENDPQKLIKKAVDEQEKVNDEQVDESVQKAFETALFTLSKIVFDKEHRRAVVGYSFVCGMLCGNGNTLVLKKVGHDWKVAKRWGGWVS